MYNSSAGPYVNRLCGDSVKNMMPDNNADIIEELVSKELEAGIDGVVKTFPSIRKLICPILNVDNEKQFGKGDIN